jgi:hypothetical protein
MENSKKIISDNLKNINLEKIIKISNQIMVDYKLEYKVIQDITKNKPLYIKIVNIIVPLVFTYLFTFIYFNLPLSILFSIITFFIIFMLNKLMSVIFQILYIITIFSIIKNNKYILGTPISQTNIIKNKGPYDCLNKSLVISSYELEKELYGGYFTYSFWLYINNTCNSDTTNWNNYRYNEWKSIFYRGNSINDTVGLSSLIQFPGFWLTPVLNNMVIVFQNGSYIERLEIDNIPFNTWTNFCIVVETKSVSIYVNGNLDRTLNLHQNINIMNSYNLYLTSDKVLSKKKNECGFSGSLSELIYYNYALNSNDINKSYNFYKKIIDIYQNRIDYKNNYKIPSLITNSDYYVK